MQKILFYQKNKPKTADGLWMHKDTDGNTKLDYVSNGRVKPLGYMNSEAGGGSASGGYKAYIKLNPSSAWETDTPGGHVFASAADAAQSLGISEQDFLRFCSAQMPVAVRIAPGVFVEAYANLSAYAEDYEEKGFGYIISNSAYEGKVIEGTGNCDINITVFKESSEADDSAKLYNVDIQCRRTGELS